MAEDSIAVTAGSGTALATHTVTQDGTTAHREDMVVSSPSTTAAVAEVRNAIPVEADYGLNVRPVGTKTSTNPTARRTSVTAADGTTAPTLSASDWVTNPGGVRRVRVFLTLTFTGGTTPSAAIRFWFRSGDTTNGKMGKGPLYVFEAGNQMVDLDVDLDDYLWRVEEITGGPSATDIDSWDSWRSGG